MRIAAFSLVPKQKLNKVAFDTRRIDQNTQYNPRRNLQYYLRSQPFVNENDAPKIEALAKLKTVVGNIKEAVLGEPEWFDSYLSDLDHSLDKIFFVADKTNFDFFSPAIQHLEEILFVRYGMRLADIEAVEEDQLRNVLLAKDEKLAKSGIYKSNYLSKINRDKIDRKEQERSNKEKLHKSQKIATVLSELMDVVFENEEKIATLKEKENKISEKISSKTEELNAIRSEKEEYKKIASDQISKEKIISRRLVANTNVVKKIVAEKNYLDNIIITKTTNKNLLESKIKKEALFLQTLTANYSNFENLSMMKFGNDRDNVLKEMNHNLAQQNISRNRISNDRIFLMKTEQSKVEAETLANKKLSDYRTFSKKLNEEQSVYDSVHSERIVAEKIFKDKVASEKKLSAELSELKIFAGIEIDKITRERQLLEKQIRDNLEQINKLKS